MEGGIMTGMKKEEQIGFHKGAIQTLVNERNEMIKIAQVTEELIKVHLEQLKKLGVDLSKQ
jgi:hypothetical protein